MMTDRSSSSHSRSCRIHSQGCDQSSSITINVLGIDCGVRSGLIREVNVGAGLVSR